MGGRQPPNRPFTNVFRNCSVVVDYNKGGLYMKLLLADDEVFTRNGLMNSIRWEELGIDSVESAEDGFAAYEKALWFKPDILLTDVRMPRVDGIELAKKVREVNPGCVIIFMSAYSDKELLKSAIRLRVVDYIEKPFTPDEVSKVITEARKQAVSHYADGKDEAESKAKSRIAAEIIKIVHEEYANPELTISYICERLFLSHSHICTAFKKNTGKTINQYINGYRVELSKMHIGDKQMDFAEVAAQVGFVDQNYFTKVFKRFTKMTPSEYRNKTV